MGARLGLGLAALGRPGYLNVGHGAELGDDRSVDALRARTFEVLDPAYEAGVRDFDVARSYGRGEEFLGEWLRAHNPPGVHVSSKWGYVYTAGWEVAHDPPEVKHHDVETFQRQLNETRENLGEWLQLYQIHSATPESGVLRDDARAAGDAGDRPPARRLGQRASPRPRRSTSRSTLGLFDAVQATWNLLERAAGPALARAHAAGLRVYVKEALANGRLADRDAAALAAALAQPWATVVLSGAASIAVLQSNLRARDTAPGDARPGRGQRRLLGAPLLAGLELSGHARAALGEVGRLTSPPWARTSRRAIARPRPAPPAGAGLVAAVERLEHVREVLGREARPVVGDVDARAGRPAARRACARGGARCRAGSSARAAARPGRRRACTGPFVTTSRRTAPGSTVSAARRAIAARSTGSPACVSRAYSARENANRSPTSRSRWAALSCARVERVLVADPALDRLQRAAQREQRRAQVVRDRRHAGSGARARRRSPCRARRRARRPCRASPRRPARPRGRGWRPARSPAHRPRSAPRRRPARERAQHPALQEAHREREHERERDRRRRRARSPSGRPRSRGARTTCPRCPARDTGGSRIGVDRPRCLKSGVCCEEPPDPG